MGLRCDTCEGADRHASAYRRPRGRIASVWLLLALLAPLAVAAVGLSATSLGALPAVWRDDQGRAFDLHGLLGRRVALTMAYTSCHRVCPISIRLLQQWQQELDRRGATAEFVVIGYDPETDDTASWHQYRASRHLTRANWHFLVGTRAMVEQTARQLGFGFWKDGTHVMHGLRIVCFDEHGMSVAATEADNSESNAHRTNVCDPITSGHTEVAAQ
jgi:cytochrome oxidase Cu insertion factor (SCO1/SenC/PrrC family)